MFCIIIILSYLSIDIMAGLPTDSDLNGEQKRRDAYG